MVDNYDHNSQTISELYKALYKAFRELLWSFYIELL